MYPVKCFFHFLYNQEVRDFPQLKKASELPNLVALHCLLLKGLSFVHNNSSFLKSIIWWLSTMYISSWRQPQSRYRKCQSLLKGLLWPNAVNTLSPHPLPVNTNLFCPYSFIFSEWHTNGIMLSYIRDLYYLGLLPFTMML